ncbi:putative dynein light chain type 1 family protein [Zea mays]|uniref:Dynein light chain n=1 Tax=Zea mays TaxID=4577 RepID=B4FJN1_MAIZE|nr:putative dynein light chain type 1 family protein [Zea mays]ACF82324.1 unknown [Zea mays]AQK91823.1 Dynein light chain type 1 family protein [Zea mays]|eukprot:NP_001136640.1 putative dynein light chain type 1 family protein [Zea mays]
MAARHGSRRTRADQWLFGGKWRGTVKETRHPPPVPEAKLPNPVPVQKDEGVCLEKPRVQREVADVAPGRRSMPEMEINMKEVVAVLGVKVMAADMPPFMQLHAFRCAKRSHDNLDKFSSRQLAHDVKKEFDKVYGPTWHCIVGTSYGSFVTHSRGCFLYFSMDKIIVMLFKTKIRKVLAS